MEVKHTTIRNEKLFCMNCGGEYRLTYPDDMIIVAEKTYAFNQLHHDCEKTWTQPEVDKSESLENKMVFWLTKGERGMSSEVMFEKFSGTKIRREQAQYYPSDPSDFKRCHLLLETIPEWKSRINELKELSETWSNLVDNWDKLTELLLEQMKTGEANGMYELMKKLGC